MILTLIYTLLLGLLCAGFVEVAIYALFPAPVREYDPWEYSPEKSVKQKEEVKARDQALRAKLEVHSTKHYFLSLVGSTVLAVTALRVSSLPVVIAQGILLGSVVCLGTGTVFGISGGGRSAKLAVVTVSLVVALVLGWVEFGVRG